MAELDTVLRVAVATLGPVLMMSSVSRLIDIETLLPVLNMIIKGVGFAVKAVKEAGVSSLKTAQL